MALETSLKGKTVVLIGAGGIASGYARLFAQEEMNIVVVSRGESCEKLAEEIGDLGSNVIAMHADASNNDEIGKVIGDAFKEFEMVHALVNGSGGNDPNATFHNIEDYLTVDPKVVENIMANNLYSKDNAMKHYARHISELIRKGKKAYANVVNITSMTGIVPLTKVAYYSMANAATESLTRSVAALWGASQVGRANCVAVGFAPGKQNMGLLYHDHAEPNPSILTPRGEEIIANTAQKRILNPEEIAPTVVFLADPKLTGGITGATYRVDAGYNIVNLAGSSGYDKNKK